MRKTLLVAVLVSVMSSFSLSAAIQGVVMNVDGAPIAGARVQLFAPEGSAIRASRWVSAAPERAPLATTTSGAKGEFSIDLAISVPVLVQIEAAGHVPADVLAAPGDDLGAIALRDASETAGKVTAAGKPVANATVLFSDRDSLELIRHTDEKGAYTIPAPKEWAWRVLVLQAGFAPLHLERRSGDPDVPVALELSSGITLSGTTVGADGRTPVAATLFVDGLPAGKSDGNGAFAVEHVPADWKELLAVSGNTSGFLERGGGDRTIRLRPSASLAGTVVDASSQRPVPGSIVRLREGGRLRLGEDLQSAVADAKGKYEIAPVLPGTYNAAVSAPGYVSSSVEVQVGTARAVQRVLAIQLGATVTGSVQDENRRAVAGATINYRPEATGRMFRLSAPIAAHSAPDGRFVMRAVPADEEFKLSARKRGFPEAETSRLEVAPGERKSGVSITIPRGVLLTGRVTDLDGDPLPDISVIPGESDTSGMPGRMMIRISRRPGSESDVDIVTSADGRFELRLAEGRYDVAFRGAGFATKIVRAVQVAGRTDPLEVTMEPGAVISGKIIRNNGSGVPDVNVFTPTGANQTPVMSAPDGSFTIADLSPGPTQIFFSKPEEFLREMRTATAPDQDFVLKLPPGGTISGRVIDKATKAPITDFQAGVQQPPRGPIRIVGPSNQKSFHAEDGVFTLENVPLGVFDLVVSSPGFVDAKTEGLKVEEGVPLRDIEVALQPGVHLAGKVTGPDGAALAGVSVTLAGAEDDSLPPGVVLPRGLFSGGRTDANGEYSIDSVAPGEQTVIFDRDGYLTERKTINATGKEARLDVRLSRGQPVRGVVVTDSGAPVAEAYVSARSAVRDAGYSGVRADQNGAFEIQGLAPGRYTFRASKSGLVSGNLDDVDIATAGQIRLVMGSGGTITGSVRGLSESDLASAIVMATASDGGGRAPVDARGEFRIEGVAPGTVTVQAIVGGMSENRQSPRKTVELEPGSEVRVDLEFSGDTVIQGRITTGGVPVDNARISFRMKNSAAPSFAASAPDANGRYEVKGLQDGEYDVSVFDMTRRTSFNTTYTVRGSGNFDVDIAGSTVQGVVTDAETGAPLVGATVTLLGTDSRSFFGPGASTDSSGAFTIESIAAGSYRARAEKQSYGQQILDVTVSEGSSPSDLRFRLYRTDGITLTVVDARDGRQLDAMLRVTDSMNRPAFEGAGKIRGDGSIRILVADGSYRVTVSANGYAPSTVQLSAPGPTVRVGLTPGGTLVVDSTIATRAKLVSSTTGEEFRQGWFGRSDFGITPGVTTIDHVTPGTYSLVVLDANGQPANSVPATVSEGQTTRVQVK